MKMSNSPLVTYTKLSPNHSGRRNHVIDTVSIHCMAGNASVETCGALFADPARKASSNYGIGSDGRIALYVDEANRSWCTSNAANDHRAITIEVANNGGAPDWPVSDKAYSALLDLLTDICRRNNIKELLWKGNKSLIGQVGKQNMTVHRWFAAKACPGDYLYNRHGEIAAEVNRRLKGEDESVDIAKLISEMTNKQAYQLMQKAELHAKTIQEPSWSKEEGHWAKATANGIVDGTSPERPMKRDEVIAVLGRKGLL
jgi:N-acetyl-anhydromuramyl-L-alanine amidase AmpD|nr:MAG TPA: N-acetylmuramoyl-L-alanine amidase [Caudoviricetes sp.]